MKSNSIMLIIFILGVFVLFPYKNALPQNQGGLSFSEGFSKGVSGTSYNVFKRNIDWVDESLNLEFDLSLFNNKMIGHILTCKSEQTEMFNMFVSGYKGRKSLIINLNLTFASKSISIPIDINDCVSYIWHKVSIYIEPKKGYVRLKIGDVTKEVSFAGVEIDESCQYIFGVCDHYLGISPFAISNLRYEGDGEEKFYFPLNEESGNIVYDDEGAAIGSVVNPIWLRPKHNNWELISEFEMDEIVAIFHDKGESNIVIYNSELSHIFNLRSSRLIEQNHSFSDRFKLPNGSGVNYLFNDKSGDLFMFNNETKGANYASASYNYKSNTLKLISRKDLGNRYHHNSVFVNNESNKLYQFGGYGHFSYSNKFYGYDIVSNRWNVEEFSGDHISPRFYTSVASDFSDNKSDTYIFGGYGNKSGHQEEGGRYLYDLYRVKLNKHSVEKIADFDVDFNTVPCRNMILNADKSSFYTLLYPQYKPESSIVLYEFNWSTGEYAAISDSIPLISREINTCVHLFEDKRANVLICAVQEYIDLENSIVKLYQLLSPPIIGDKIEQNKIISKGIMNEYGVILLTIFILCMIVLLLYIYRRKASRLPESEAIICQNYEVENEAEKLPVLNKLVNSIYLIGEFTVINKDERDISYLFSTKIRQLFLLILMYTLRNTSKSISSNELSAILWPDKDHSKAKNIRGVSIKNLRDILTEIDGITLVHSNSKWFFEIDNNMCYCDYIWLIKNDISTLKVDDVQYNDIEKRIAVLRRGVLLKSAEYEWLDSYKADFEDRVIQDFYPIMLHHYQNQGYQLSYKLAQLLMNYDPLSEEIVRIEIKSLEGLGDYVKAKVRFRQFALNYYYACNKNLSYEEFVL